MFEPSTVEPPPGFGGLSGLTPPSTGLPHTPPPAAPPVAPPPAAPSVAPAAAPAYTAPAPYAGGVPGMAPMPVVEPPRMPPPASTAGIQDVDPDTVSDDGKRIHLDNLLEEMVAAKSSDLHLSAGAPPTVRVHGEMKALAGYDALSPSDIETLMTSVMTEEQNHRFEEDKELDFAYTVPGKARFRVNVLRQQGHVGAVLRVIPWEIKALEALNMPEIIGTFSDLPRGFVLVTGPTGSGKSTTLAAMIDRANRTRSAHIITIEDPIEFLHQHRNSIVNQREVGTDTHGFGNALKHVLRQDPDIILVGELRDLETISVALTAAETGHLVFATLHTQSAQETITRIVDVFPAGQQQQVRTQLAASLQAVVCQTLCKTPDGSGRIAAAEIMVVDTGIRSMIREDKLNQIPSALQAGKSKGNQTLNMHLAELVKAGKITWDEGRAKCSDKNDFETLAGTKAEAERLAAQRAAQSHAMPGNNYGRL